MSGLVGRNRRGPRRLGPLSLLRGSARIPYRALLGNLRGRGLGWICALLLSLLLLGCKQEEETRWHYVIEYRFYNTGNRAQLWVALPSELPGRQRLGERTYSLRPHRVVGKGLDSAALFQMVGEKDSLVLRMEGDVYTRKAPVLPVYDSLLQNSLENWASQSMAYREWAGDSSYLHALSQGFGDCSEFADLMVALCEGAGYEARRQEGLSGPGRGALAHAWAECSGPKGWARLDPVRRQTAPSRKDREGYLYIPNLGAWPEFAGQRMVALYAKGRQPAVEMRSQLKEMR